MLNMEKQAGFGMLEAMICVFVIICSASAIHIGIRASDSMELRREAIYLIGKLRLLREASRVSYKQGLFASDAAMGAGKMIPNAGKGYYIKADGRKIEYREMPQGMRMVMNRQDIYFYRDGSSTTTTIHLIKNGRNVRVIVDLAGRIRLYDK